MCPDSSALATNVLHMNGCMFRCSDDALCSLPSALRMCDPLFGDLTVPPGPRTPGCCILHVFMSAHQPPSIYWLSDEHVRTRRKEEVDRKEVRKLGNGGSPSSNRSQEHHALRVKYADDFLDCLKNVNVQEWYFYFLPSLWDLGFTKAFFCPRFLY